MSMFGIQVYDVSKQRPLVEKIRSAAEALLAKHGKVAEVCVVHPSMLSDGQDLALVSEEVGIHVILSAPSLPVLPGHLFVGLEQELEFEKAA